MDNIHLHDEGSWLGLKLIRIGEDELKDLEQHVSDFKDSA